MVDGKDGEGGRAELLVAPLLVVEAARSDCEEDARTRRAGDVMGDDIGDLGGLPDADDGEPMLRRLLRAVDRSEGLGLGNRGESMWSF